MKKARKLALTTVTAFGLLGMASVEAAPPEVVLPNTGTLMSDFEQRKQDALAEGIVDLGGSLTEMEKPKLELPDELKVQVNGFKITGQDIFPEDKLLALLKYNKGELMTFGDLQKQADILTDYLRSHGYIAARVYLPAQKINDGIVEYTVVIGKVGEITINNYTRISKAVLEQQVAFLRRDSYIKTSRLERAVWLLTDLAAANAEATLVPGAAPGAVNIVFDVKPTAEKVGMLYADNYGNRYSGYGEFGVSYDVLNPLHCGDHLAFNILHTNRKLYNMAFRYTVPLPKDGLTANIGYSDIGYEQGGEVRDLGLIGKARVYSAGFDYAIKRSPRNNLYAGLSFEYAKNFDEQRSAGLQYSDKTTKAATLSLYGNERDKKGATVWRLDYKYGNLGFNNEQTHYYYDLSNTEGSYHKLRGYMLRRQDFNPRLSLFFTARAQYSNKNLDSYEHFSLGGISGVKAYPQSEASGDIGYLTKAELRWLLPLKANAQTFHVATYLEHGTIWLNKANYSNGENRRRLQGVGIGLIWQRANDWFIRLDYAWRLGAEKVQADLNDSRGRFWAQGGLYF